MKNSKLLLIISLVLFILVGTLTYFFEFWGQRTDEMVEDSNLEIPSEYGIPVGSFNVREFTVQRNDFLSQILRSLGATNENIAQVLSLQPDVFDVKNLKAGNRYKAFYNSSDSIQKLRYWVYEKNPYDYCVFCFQDTLRVYSGQKEVKRKLKTSEAEISSSLWNAAVENQIDPNISMALSDIYAWTIDFFGLQNGDKFSVLYDELYVDSTCIGVGQIYAAQFFHGGKGHYAFYYQQDSINNYWDENGNSLKKAFLKAPLKFSRISSTFSYARKHPVLRIVRPHTGVDYAAPAGTPVMSIGEGTVISKGYAGGGGNTVKIRHNSAFTTAYLHLSRYADNLKVGQRVKQGQLIGYVGSTGISTGPHLDFRVWKNNQPVNPLAIESPSAQPIHKNNKVFFDSICNNYVYHLKFHNIQTAQIQNKKNKEDATL